MVLTFQELKVRKFSTPSVTKKEKKEKKEERREMSEMETKEGGRATDSKDNG